jgi:glutamate-ammonia-ligase adenylyltransferase
MQTDNLLSLLDSPSEAEHWLQSLGLRDPRTAVVNFQRLASTGIPLDLLSVICDQFAEAVPRLADPDMALNNFERFLHAARSPLAMAALFERDPKSLYGLLLMLNCSQCLSDHC